ncbi:MAG: hypothetical protein HYX42_16430 [Polaromonas sp.]|uniref:hypothetical protein n=1 Tax=Polaromonas sp. TaxID=1869339 RepID=UPI0025E6579F|nr:hypothetical protein [Polaromonas sp.]MBI2727830.1 hypothetical protein [Polaromonas sp.]
MTTHLSHNMRRVGAALIWAAAIALAGCATVAPSADSTKAVYEAAIADAAVASPRKVTPLMPLPQGDKVRVVSWVTESRTPCKAPDTSCATTTPPDRIWVTLAGEVQASCRAWGLKGDALRQRIEQLLGLPMDPPPQFRKAKFVTMELARDRLDRPCLGVDETNPQSPVCTVGIQASRAPDVRDYVLRQMADSFVVDGAGGPGYPFTRLGYTYDWNQVNARPNHYGASEFLVQASTPAAVITQQDTDAYCTAP